MGGGASKQEFQKSQWEGGGKQVRKAKRPDRLKGGGQASKTGRFRQRDEGGGGGQASKKNKCSDGVGASKQDRLVGKSGIIVHPYFRS